MNRKSALAPFSKVPPVAWKVTVPASSSSPWIVACTSTLRLSFSRNGVRTRWASSR
jgi:hypothetical protein